MTRPIKYNAYINEASKYIKDKRYRDAISVYEKAIKLSYGTGGEILELHQMIKTMNDSICHTYITEATISVQKGNYDEASTMYDSAYLYADENTRNSIKIANKELDSLILTQLGDMRVIYDGYHCVFLEGFINNQYPIHMTLQTTGCVEVDECGDGTLKEWIEGAYYYDRVEGWEEGNHLNLYQELSDKKTNHFVLKETNSYGKETGVFNGTVENNTFSGIYRRAKDGKEMPFALKVTQNDGSFILL